MLNNTYQHRPEYLPPEVVRLDQTQQLTVGLDVEIFDIVFLNPPDGILLGAQSDQVLHLATLQPVSNRIVEGDRDQRLAVAFWTLWNLLFLDYYLAICRLVRVRLLFLFRGLWDPDHELAFFAFLALAPDG